MGALRFIGSWSLFLIGDLISRSGLDRWERPADVYQQVMRWSVACQGDTNFGPWRDPKQEEK
jgi:hypothetical protein